MATAKKLPSGSWRCLVYDYSELVYDTNGNPVFDKNGHQKKKRIYKSFTCDDPSPKGKRRAEKDAAAWAAEKETLKKPNSEETKSISLGECLDAYIENRSAVLSPGTIREYKRSRKNDLQELMSISIYDLTREEIQIAINKAAVKHSPKSVRNMHGLLSAVLKTYRPDFALNTKLPQKKRPDIYIPTDKDIQQLLQYLQNNEMEIPVLLAAFGPMRRGEICDLTYENISGNVIHVKSAMVLDQNNEWVSKPPKTYTSDRFIEFPDFIINKIGTGTGRIVHMTPNALSSRFSHILKNAGIPHFRFHDLRHYCASIQHALGIPDVNIMQRGGWASDTTLKNVYRHVMNDRTKEMNRIANQHFTALCNTKCNTNPEYNEKTSLLP